MVDVLLKDTFLINSKLTPNAKISVNLSWIVEITRMKNSISSEAPSQFGAE